MTALLRLNEIVLQLGAHRVLNGLQLDVNSGEVHALLGANGAGKSTLAYMLMGSEDYQPQAGSMTFAGESLLGLPMHERARRGIALAWQEPARIEGLSVTQFLRTGAPNVDPSTALAAVGLAPADYLDRPLDKTLSGGERKRIELAGVVALKPRLAILDEPTAGIDLLSLGEIMDVIDALKRQGAAVLVITHQELVAARADRASQLCGGRIVCSGQPVRVIENFKARRCVRCDGATCDYD